MTTVIIANKVQLTCVILPFNNLIHVQTGNAQVRMGVVLVANEHTTICNSNRHRQHTYQNLKTAA